MVRRGVPSASIALDPPVHDHAPMASALAARTLALSGGSCQMLARIAPLPNAGVIRHVEVSIEGHAGRTRIAASDLAAEALGRVVRYTDLMQVLRDAARTHEWARPESDGPGPTLTVHAEGDTGEAARVRDIGQWALLGDVHAPHASATLHDQAFERFTPQGPLALLPLAQPGRWSLVWCDSEAACRRRLADSRSELEAELSTRIGPRFGALRLDGDCAVAPLVRRVRRHLDSDTEAWIGNAAQALHPVAGQGLNLGLRDAFELADAIAQALRTSQPMPAALRSWRRGRWIDRTGTVALTDLMAASFTWPLARPLQSPFLALLDLAPSLRRGLAARLMYGHR
jgi:2-octaprenyl-6-methoxyphenol hydroxylase